MMLKDIALNTLPGLEHLPDDETLPGYDQPNEFSPKRDPNYIFRLDDVRVMVGHMRNDSPEGLMLTGPKGSGKSSLVHQMHAYLNRPLFYFTGSRTAEFEDMLGTKEIIDGDTITLDGPLVQAVSMPYATFLYEEVDRSEASVSVALNPILDGYDLVHILDSGRRISLPEGFRFMATLNTNGQGDMTGDYNTANVMDTSFLDRNWMHEVWYPHPDHEYRILRNAIDSLKNPGDSDIPEEPIRLSIKLANDIRYLYTGRDTEVSASGQAVGGAGRIHVTFSTRALLMLWRAMAQFPYVEQPIIYALKLVITNKCTPECAEAIHRLAEAHFGGQ